MHGTGRAAWYAGRQPNYHGHHQAAPSQTPSASATPRRMPDSIEAHATPQHRLRSPARGPPGQPPRPPSDNARPNAQRFRCIGSNYGLHRDRQGITQVSCSRSISAHGVSISSLVRTNTSIIRRIMIRVGGACPPQSCGAPPGTPAVRRFLWLHGGLESEVSARHASPAPGCT